MSFADQIVHDFDFAPTQRGGEFFLHRCYQTGTWQASEKHRYNVDDMVLSRLGSRPLGPLEADLRDVAVYLYLADRLARRDRQGKRDAAGFRWARKIKVRIGVRCEEQWIESGVKDALCEYLKYNTGDEWQLDFVGGSTARSAVESQMVLQLDMGASLARRYPKLTVALFSGGLDSTAGLAHELQIANDTRFRTSIRKQ